MAGFFAAEHQSAPEGLGFVLPVERVFTVAAADIVLSDTNNLIRFPGASGDKVYLDLDSLEYEPTDLDTNGTPLIKTDLGIGDSDGVIDQLLIDASLAAQSGVVDYADDQYGAAVSRWIDVAGKWLIHRWDANAATAVAGSFRIKYTLVRGIVVRTVNIKGPS